MQLLDKQLEARFRDVGTQDNIPDPIVIARFVYPLGSAVWWATEYDPQTRTFFGYVTVFGLGNQGDEWGFFSLDELEAVRGRYSIRIERDTFFREAPFSEVMRRERACHGLPPQ